MNKQARAKRAAVSRGVLAGIERAALLELRKKGDVATVVTGEILRSLESAGLRITRKPREVSVSLEEALRISAGGRGT